MQFKANQRIIVLTPAIDYETITNITEIYKDKILLKIKGINIIKPKMKVLCLALDGSDIYEFYSETTESYEYTIGVKQPEYNNSGYVEKRKFKRLECNMDILGTIEEYKGRKIQTDKLISGKVLNLSAGGVKIVSKLNIPEETVLKFRLKLDSVIDCRATIVRNEIKEHGYELGCKFKEEDMETIKTISMHVFNALENQG